MKEILTALRELIQDEMAEIKGIYILPDPDMLPTVVKYPCIGLKDGESSFSEGMAESENERSSILIYIYQQILKEEASVMGEGGKKGVLDLMDDLRTALNFNLLNDLIHSAYIPDVFASETMLVGENIFVQRKGCRFVYEK